MSSVEVLLVEDNPADAVLVQEVLKTWKVSTTLNIVRDGDEALDYLEKKNGFENASVPDLIFLDLNLPKKNGWEVLKEIKNNDSIRHLPVIVLTSSPLINDVHNSYRHFANSYIRKPLDFDDFTHVMHGIENFWLNIAELPSS